MTSMLPGTPLYRGESCIRCGGPTAPRYRRATAGARTVAVESPLRGAPSYAVGLQYARAALFDSLARAEAPYASHLLYPQVLDDANPADRTMGLAAAASMAARLEAAAVYVDLGLSEGMLAAVQRFEELDLPVEYRTIGSAELRPTEGAVP
jgi:hypothetical protein